MTAPPALDELALLEWSLYGDVLPPRTLFRGIRTLAPGQVLRVGKDGEAKNSERTTIRRTRSILRATLRMPPGRPRAPGDLGDGDGPGRDEPHQRTSEVGVMLSGGVNSGVDRGGGVAAREGAGLQLLDQGRSAIGRAAHGERGRRYARLPCRASRSTARRTGESSRTQPTTMKCRSGTCTACPYTLSRAAPRGWDLPPAFRLQPGPPPHCGHGSLSLDRCRRRFSAGYRTMSSGSFARPSIRPRARHRRTRSSPSISASRCSWWTEARVPAWSSGTAGRTSS